MNPIDQDIPHASQKKKASKKTNFYGRQAEGNLAHKKS